MEVHIKINTTKELFQNKKRISRSFLFLPILMVIEFRSVSSTLFRFVCTWIPQRSRRNEKLVACGTLWINEWLNHLMNLLAHFPTITVAVITELESYQNYSISLVLTIRPELTLSQPKLKNQMNNSWMEWEGERERETERLRDIRASCHGDKESMKKRNVWTMKPKLCKERERKEKNKRGIIKGNYPNYTPWYGCMGITWKR